MEVGHRMNQGQDNRPVSDEEYFKDKKESQPAKYTAKDSVFTDLFRDKKFKCYSRRAQKDMHMTSLFQ